MAVDKRNTFFDVEDESDDGASQGYDSEADEIKKGATNSGHASKRRRLSDDEDAASDYDNDDDDDDEEGGVNLTKNHDVVVDKRFALPEGMGFEDDDGAQDNDNDSDVVASSSSTKPTTKKAAAADPLPDVSRPLTKRNLVATEKAVSKSGLLYLSRIPPFMKPTKVRSLLEPHGTLNRIFLSPEDPQQHTRRVKSGGNKKRMFVDGWVEFVRKKDAKNAAALLNGNPLGGKKGSYYRDDVWSCVYLKGFKWHHLTEQIASEAAERQGRMRVEISKANRENKEFLRNVERAKVEEGMESKRSEQARKRRRKDGDGGEDGDGDGDGGETKNNSNKRSKRQFKQAAVRDRSLTTGGGGGGDGEGGGNQQQQKTAPGDAKRVLSKLF